MEVELEPRVKPLPFKVKGMSRESPLQKASHVLDSDLRNHWSTGTNTKKWILLELDEPCLLSHSRIYNKSVLEWEISAGLHYKVTVAESAGFQRRRLIFSEKLSGWDWGGWKVVCRITNNSHRPRLPEDLLEEYMSDRDRTPLSFCIYIYVKKTRSNLKQ
ncbi:hypothetical protein H5410_012471 [Solanum commersonii]|uniref:Uncharacterized protein n=1 Tax=Solanum commersonii TaxID=4109 RepID=A0A9J6ARM5_SOLCO|nr:hypothetical protein H5410_012471 [Solanum commersonii]